MKLSVGAPIMLGLVALVIAHYVALVFRVSPAISLWFPPRLSCYHTQSFVWLGKSNLDVDSFFLNGEFLPHVFERFRQADSSITRTFGGLGLGLAIVRQIVELHRGTVTAASEGENKGATFTVQLPIYKNLFCNTNLLILILLCY